MKRIILLTTLLLAACGNGPGTAPAPPTSNDTFNSGNPVQGGTSNDVFHGPSR